jgi:TatD DNase family protein
MKVAPFIDFHTHSRWNGDDIVEVVSIHGKQKRDVIFYTIGYHPWWTIKLLTEKELDLMTDHYIKDPFCLGLGEFGLDNLKGADIDLQEEIFIQQIQIVNQLKTPVIIHCVRAFDRMLRLRKKYGETPWVVHGFVRNKTLAKQVLDSGMYISVAPHEKLSISFKDTLQFLPLDRIFLETDSDFTLNIRERYGIFAALREIEVPYLKDQMYQNFITFFSNKWKYHIG